MSGCIDDTVHEVFVNWTKTIHHPRKVFDRDEPFLICCQNMSITRGMINNYCVTKQSLKCFHER